MINQNDLDGACGVQAKPAAANGEDNQRTRAAIAVAGQNLDNAVIMIVDDEPINVKVLQKYLMGAGHKNFVTTTDSTRAFAMAQRKRPDVVLLDVMMPEVDGISILKQIRADSDLAFTPVIIVTASDDTQTKSNALESGASDFLAKPVDPTDLLPRVRNALMVKSYQNHLRDYSTQLEKEVRARTAAIEASRKHVIYCLARAAEYRDDITGNHVVRVGRYAAIIANEMGLSDEHIEMLELAAQLHDVGKIAIPDAILNKPGKLTKEEYELMQKHCDCGREIIMATPDATKASGIDWNDWADSISDVVDFPILMMASMIATSHHEWWNGNGYPNGLRGEVIPLEGRIVAVADVYDALCSKRPYKAAMSQEQCLQILADGNGTQFDPAVLAAFHSRYDEISSIQRQLSDDEEPTGVEEMQIRR